MSTASELLAEYIKAEKLVLAGQTAQWGDRRLTMADLPEIRAGRLEMERRVGTEARQAVGDYAPARHQLANFAGSAG